MWDTGFGIYVDTPEFAFFRVPFKLFLQVSMIQQRSYEISVSESNYQSLPVHNFQASTCFEHAGSGQNSKYFELNHCLLHLWFLEFEFTEFQPVSGGSFSRELWPSEHLPEAVYPVYKGRVSGRRRLQFLPREPRYSANNEGE